jgi:signal transduction histidine kinase
VNARDGLRPCLRGPLPPGRHSRGRNPERRHPWGKGSLDGQKPGRSGQIPGRCDRLRAGADDFLSKPFDRHELLLRVATFVRLGRQDATIRRQMERLRELESLKDDLASLLVHDLRNPLAGMIAFLEVLREEMSGSTRQEELDDLDQALISAGRMRGALNEMLRLRELEGDGVDVRRANGDEAVIDADRDLVVRSVENLVHNAVRYSPRGGAVEVTIRTGDGGSVSASISCTWR